MSAVPSDSVAEEQDQEQERVSVQPTLVDLPLRDNSATMPALAARAYALSHLGEDAVLRITAAPTKRPDLLYEAARLKPALFDMTAFQMGPMRVSLRIQGAQDGEFDEEVPLRMLAYRTLEDPALTLNTAACAAADQANIEIQRHNRFLASMLSLFVKQNGCSFSAGHVTEPAQPVNLTETRVQRIKDLLADKHAATVLAVRYLNEHGKVCMADYDIADAVQTANDLAFEVETAAMLAKALASGKTGIRFRIKGMGGYATWSGKPEDRDSKGRRVKFEADKYHTFLSPDVKIVPSDDELVRV